MTSAQAVLVDYGFRLPSAKDNQIRSISTSSSTRSAPSFTSTTLQPLRETGRRSSSSKSSVQTGSGSAGRGVVGHQIVISWEIPAAAGMATASQYHAHQSFGEDLTATARDGIRVNICPASMPSSVLTSWRLRRFDCLVGIHPPRDSTCLVALVAVRMRIRGLPIRLAQSDRRRTAPHQRPCHPLCRQGHGGHATDDDGRRRAVAKQEATTANTTLRHGVSNARSANIRLDGRGDR